MATFNLGSSFPYGKPSPCDSLADNTAELCLAAGFFVAKKKQRHSWESSSLRDALRYCAELLTAYEREYWKNRKRRLFEDHNWTLVCENIAYAVVVDGKRFDANSIKTAVLEVGPP